MRFLLATLAMTFCLLTVGHAATVELPYNYYQLEQKITVTPQDGSKPIAIQGGITVTDYRVVEYYYRSALVTLAARKPFVVTVLLYTSSAVYVVNPGLIVPSDHETTVSALIPSNVPSLLRILAFDRVPDSKLIASFAARPSTAASQYLLGDAWLRPDIRPTSTGVLFPWEETFRYFSRVSGTRARWPYAYARLSSTRGVHAKDCVVSYSGLPSVEIGEHGPVGAWPIEIAETWRASFYVPSRISYRHAVLILRSIPFGSEYELRLNGFTVPVLPDDSGLVFSAGVDIRNYLQAGMNELELRSPTFGQGGRLTAFELWVD
jgi:hypothetical protein